MYFVTVFAVFAVVLCYSYLVKRNTNKLPSGPLGLPFLGNIHQFIGHNPFEKLRDWADKYGKIYSINFCSQRAVVINDPKLMRDIFNTFQSTGKLQTNIFLLVSRGPYGVLNSEGKIWSEQRKFCIKNLKKFGFGNKHMETLILSEANEICNWIKNENKKRSQSPLNLQPIFIQSVVNTMWTMVASTRVDLGDSKMTSLIETFMNRFQYATKTGLFFLPWLKHFIPGVSGYTALKYACEDVLKYIEQEFKDHTKTYQNGSHRDLIDAYIEDSENDPLKWKNAIATVVELFLAGSETTGSTMTWLLFYLSVNPEIQLKLQKEIDTVVGVNENISLDHKPWMLYTEAVILETMRFNSFAPMGIPHRLLEDLEIDGYKLPKGLLLLQNLYHCHYNKDIWNDPEVFRPERFLGVRGEMLKKFVIPFQLGKRQCVGEPLAKDILFVFTTRIFQLFNVSPDENVEVKNYYKPDVGFNHMPPHLGLCFSPRKRKDQ